MASGHDAWGEARADARTCIGRLERWKDSFADQADLFGEIGEVRELNSCPFERLAAVGQGRERCG